MAGGRPNKYTTNIEPFLNEIRVLRVNGIEYHTIAKMLNIAPSTLYKHKDEIEEFSEYLKETDNIIVDKTEKTLYKLAWGEVKTTKIKTVYNSDGTIRTKEETTDVLAPNVAANIFILTNLAPDRD